MTAKRYALKGINNDVETCEKCGKTNLKRVAWLAEIDSDGNEGEAFAVGMDCAGKMLGWSGSKTRQQISILNDFDVIIEKTRNIEKYGKEKIADWINRLHWNLLHHGKATVDSLTLTQKLNDGTMITVKVW